MVNLSPQNPQNDATKTDGGLTPPVRLFLSKPVLLGK
jgi:hypothetical protein